MNITRSTDNLSAINTGLLAVGVSSLTDTHFQELDAAFSGHLSKWANEREFSGKAASTLMVPTFGNISATALLLVGLGDASSDEIRNAAAKIGREARTLKCRDVAIAISSDAGEILEWLLAGNYKYEVYKPTDGTTPAIENLTLVGCKVWAAALCFYLSDRFLCAMAMSYVSCSLCPKCPVAYVLSVL